MNTWKAILAAAVIFFTGVASGAFAARLLEAQRPRAATPVPPGGPPVPWMRQRIEFLHRLSDKLDLNPTQRANIDRAVHEAQQHLREIWEPIEPRAKEEIAGLRRRIEAELTASQRERFDALIRSRTNRVSGEALGGRRHAGGTNREPPGPSFPDGPNRPAGPRPQPPTP